MKSKITNFLLVFGITLLAVQLFFPKTPEAPKSGILLSITKQEYVLPNLPEIAVQNHTATGITFNTCN